MIFLILVLATLALVSAYLGGAVFLTRDLRSGAPDYLSCGHPGCVCADGAPYHYRQG